MKRLIGSLALLLALFPQCAKSAVGVWVDQGVVIAPLSSDQPGQPNVLFEASGCVIVANPCFKMWFGAANGVSYAESSNGTSWTRYASNPLISAAVHHYPHVFKNGSTYYLYDGPGAGPVAAYTSTDGIAWTLQVANALGAGQAWEHSFIGQLNVAGQDSGGTWHGYYASLNASNAYVSGHVTSTDLLNWTKDPNNPTLTTEGASNLHVHKVGSAYYGWSQILQPGIPAFGSLGLPSDTTRLSSLSLAGPWTPLSISTMYRTTAAEGIGSTLGQIADPFLLEANGNIYAYFSISTQGNTANTQIGCLIAFSTTLAQLVQTYEGIQNIPFPTTAGLALNLTQLASDNFARADANPIGGNWTPISVSAGWGANQIVSGKAEPSATNTNDASFYNAFVWPNDQWFSATLSVATSASVGGFLRANTSGVITGYMVFWAGPAGGLGNAGSLNIGRELSGAFVSLKNIGSITMNAGDVLTGAIVGTTISVYINGNLITTVTDSNIASGAAGIHENSTVIANAQISAWSGGGVTNAPAPPPPGVPGAYDSRGGSGAGNPPGAYYSGPKCIPVSGNPPGAYGWVCTP